jgi:hypothetical protein
MRTCRAAKVHTRETPLPNDVPLHGQENQRANEGADHHAGKNDISLMH